jgi:hypothetical protein
MLIPRATLDGIRDGRVTLAFRRWSRPRVRAGTRLRTAVGVVEVVAVDEVDGFTDAQARAAGAAGREELQRVLATRRGERLYRIGLRYAGVDPRIALRDDTGNLDAVLARLRAIDARAQRGPWTRAVLELIDRHPATRAAELAPMVGRQRLPFKADVRKLKELGLTESLERGYRLSPRGRAVLAAVQGAKRSTTHPSSPAR